MQNIYLNSVNLNSQHLFPYLCMDSQNGITTPKPPGFHIMHWHEDFQFIYVITGEVYLHTLDHTYIVASNNGVFINKNVVHLVLASDDCHYKSILFPTKLVTFFSGSPASKYVEQISACEQISCIPFDLTLNWHEAIVNTLKKLTDVTPASSPCYEYDIQVLLSELFLVLIKNVTIDSIPMNGVIQYRMQKFLEFIEIHYTESISLDRLAKSADVSKSECLRCFKISMKNTPYQYLTEYRLMKATELLINTSLSIGDICEKVGFNSQSHFGKVFRERTSLPPLAFRNQHSLNIDKNTQ